MKRTITALAATLVVSSSLLSAQDIGFALQVEQWELRTDLTDLTFRREKQSYDGGDHWDRTRFSINGQALYTISPSLSAGVETYGEYPWFSREDFDVDGESLERRSYWTAAFLSTVTRIRPRRNCICAAARTEERLK